MKFIATCESIFNEIQQLRRDLVSGKIEPDVYAMQMGGIAQLEKQQKLMLAGAITEHRLKRKLSIGLNKGIIGIEQESIDCVDRNMVITRENCLEYSGEEKNIESCRSCEQFKITRKLLIK